MPQQQQQQQQQQQRQLSRRSLGRRRLGSPNRHFSLERLVCWVLGGRPRSSPPTRLTVVAFLLTLLVGGGGSCAEAAQALSVEGRPGQAGCPCVGPTYEVYWRNPTSSAEPADVFNCTSPPPFALNFQPMNISGQFNAASGECIMHPGYGSGDGAPVSSDYGASCKKHYEGAAPGCFNMTTGQELPPDVRADVRASPQYHNGNAPSLPSSAAPSAAAIVAAAGAAAAKKASPSK